MLRSAGRPSTVLMAIGATRYTEFGETNFLMAGDHSIVVVYDETASIGDEVARAVRDRREHDLPEASVLTQVVRSS